MMEQANELKEQEKALTDKPTIITTKTLNKLNHRHKRIAQLMAIGESYKVIAEMTGYNYTYIRSVAAQRIVKTEVRKIQEKVFSVPAKAYRKHFQGAVLTQKEIMDDKRNKASVRLNAAQDFMDRAAGKAVQKIESENSTNISVLISKLDDSTKAVEPGPKEGDNEIIDVEATESLPASKNEDYTEPAEKDEFDKWLDGNS